MTIRDIKPPTVLDLDAEIDALALRYRKANNIGMQILNAVGGSAEGLLSQLPPKVRGGLNDAAYAALNQAALAAGRSRGIVGDQPGWLNTTLASAMGAVGGFAGAPGTLAEIPVTTMLLFRAIQGAAAAQGFDPAHEGVKFDCIEVFAAAGPLSSDDGADMAYLTTRLTVNGATVQKLIATVAPRFATVMGQKLAAQTVPVLGAVAGALTNYAYTSYYQDVAQVHFGLRRLAVEADLPREELADRMVRAMKRVR